MAGNVYVFNCYNEPINTLSVQYGAVGSVPGYSAGPTPPEYTPGTTKVPRSSPLAGGKFGVGANIVTAAWDGFTGTVTVTIPDPKVGPVSIDDDLVLFVMVNQAVLVTTRGYVMGTFPVTLTDSAGALLASV